MNWVDLLILLSAVGAGAFGVLRGGMAQLISYAAFALGLLLGAAIAPSIADAVSQGVVKSVVTFTLPFALALILSAVGRRYGAQLAAGIRSEGGRQADRLAGGAFGVVVSLVGAWLLIGMLGPIGLPTVSAAIEESAIAGVLEETLPPAPLALARLQRLVVPTGIPPMLAELEPSPAPDVPTASPQEVEAAVDGVRTSVVKIISEGCGRTASGSGFVAGDGLVVTNAHVVAGVDEQLVQDRRGTHEATIVLFDPDTDLAILRTSRLASKALPVLRTPLERGARGAVLGFPGGGAFTAEAGAVLAAFDSLAGRDIYGSADTVSRQVYQLKARVRSGNSGGPFVTSDGKVAGVVFSSSAINQNIGYALTSAGIADEIDRAARLRAAVDPGPCPATR
ncbi:MAG: MarP family serine protease [Actinomycetota bacterium]